MHASAGRSMLGKRKADTTQGAEKKAQASVAKQLGLSSFEVAKIVQARSWIYVVVDRKTDTVVYVGRTIDTSRRWKQHEQTSSKCKLLRKWMDGRAPDTWEFRVVEELPGGCAPQHAKMMESYFIAKFSTVNNMLFNEQGCNGTAGDSVAEHDPVEVERLLKNGYTFPESFHVEPIAKENMYDSFRVSAVAELVQVTTLEAEQPVVSILVVERDELLARVVKPVAEQSFYHQLVATRDKYHDMPAFRSIAADDLLKELDNIESFLPPWMANDLKHNFKFHKPDLHVDSRRAPNLMAIKAYYIFGHITECVGQWLEEHMDTSSGTMQLFLEIREYVASNDTFSNNSKDPTERRLYALLSQWKNTHNRPLLNEVRFLMRHVNAEQKVMKSFVLATETAAEFTDRVLRSLRHLLVNGWYISKGDGSGHAQMLTLKHHKKEFLMLTSHLMGKQTKLGQVLWDTEGTMTQERCDRFRKMHELNAANAEAKKIEDNKRATSNRRSGKQRGGYIVLSKSDAFAGERQLALDRLRLLHTQKKIPEYIADPKKRSIHAALVMSKSSHGNGIGSRCNKPWCVMLCRDGTNFLSVGKKIMKCIAPVDPNDTGMAPGTRYKTTDRKRPALTKTLLKSKRDGIKRAWELYKLKKIPAHVPAMLARKKLYEAIVAERSHGLGTGSQKNKPWALMISKDCKTILIIHASGSLGPLCTIEAAEDESEDESEESEEEKSEDEQSEEEESEEEDQRREKVLSDLLKALGNRKSE